MTHNRPVLIALLFIAVFFGGADLSVSSLSAQDQKAEKLDFTLFVPTRLELAARQALKEKLDEHFEKYASDPYLYFAFKDLNFDGKNEIFVQFREEYEFRDQYGNNDTHVFAQTPKGIREILQVQGTDIVVLPPDYTGLNRIQVTKRLRRGTRAEIYGWDGKKEYKAVK